MDNVRCFSQGLRVRQKSGGPVMSVVSVDESFPCFPCDVAPPGGVLCTWEESSILFEHVFSPYALDIVEAETAAR